MNPLASDSRYGPNISDASGHSGTHACHCIGCCRRCGSCRTAPWHTEAYCALLARQAIERQENTSPST